MSYFIIRSKEKSCFSFPCCPSNSSAIFLTEGSFLADIEVSVDVDHIIINRAVVIEILVKFPKLLNVSKGKNLKNVTIYGSMQKLLN